MILDQRHMSGARLHTDPSGVRQFWQDHAEEMLLKRGFRFAERREGTDFEYSDHPLQPHVSVGRWCADCPRCHGGISLWREHGQSCCLDCGTIYSSVNWPPNVEHAEKALAAMPVPDMRNWNPQTESVKRLDRRMKMETPPTHEEQIAERAGISVETVRQVMANL